MAGIVGGICKMEVLALLVEPFGLPRLLATEIEQLNMNFMH
jgi:hypothetical protein